jgi:hypothetical protein
MVARHYIDTDVNCIFIEHFGEFAVGEGPAKLWEILADPAFRQGMKFFVTPAGPCCPTPLAMPISPAPKSTA